MITKLLEALGQNGAGRDISRYGRHLKPQIHKAGKFALIMQQDVNPISGLRGCLPVSEFEINRHISPSQRQCRLKRVIIRLNGVSWPSENPFYSLACGTFKVRTFNGCLYLYASE